MITGVIPARYASSRFPGKPLADIAGMTMIQRVYEQAKKCKLLDQVIIATDHPKIFDKASEFTEGVIMTSPSHNNGTERCAEVAETINSDHFLNIQGDEPFIDPTQIALVCRRLIEGDSIVTLKIKIPDAKDVMDPNIVKVVTDREGIALYFSRSPIPYFKDQLPKEWPLNCNYYKHIGLYGFESKTLKQLVRLPQSALESTESLEQLRWLENGYKIKVEETHVESIGIDVPDDIELALRIFQP